MSHPNENLIRRAYEAVNRGDIQSFVAAFAADAVWHGSGGAQISGSQAIGDLVHRMREASGGTLHVELHDVLANDRHAVALQVTRAERDGRALADRVVYVFHVRDGEITEAWFNGDPGVQAAFWG